MPNNEPTAEDISLYTSCHNRCIEMDHDALESGIDFCIPCFNYVVGLEIRAAVQSEKEPLLDVIESCWFVGGIRFGTNGPAMTVRGKVMKVLIEADRINVDGAAIRAESKEEK